MKNLSIRLKFIILLSVFAIVGSATIFAVKYFQNSLNDKSVDTAINVVSRNSVLVQKTHALVYQLMHNDDVRFELRGTVKLLDTSLQVLRNGGIPPEMQTEIYINSVSNDEVAKSLNEVYLIWDPYKKGIQSLLDDKTVLEARSYLAERADSAQQKGVLLVEQVSLLKKAAKGNTAKYSDVLRRCDMVTSAVHKVVLLSELVYNGNASKRKDLENALTWCISNVDSVNLFLASTALANSSQLTSWREEWKQLDSKAHVLLDGQFLGHYQTVDLLYQKLFDASEILSTLYLANSEDEKENIRSQLNMVLIILLIVNLLTIVVALYFINQWILAPLKMIADKTSRLAEGKIDSLIQISSGDEIGKVSQSINQSIENIRKASEFANEIGKGSFDFQFNKSGEEDQLGEALSVMRKQLKEVDQESRERNWATTGLAKFAEVLRNNQSDLSKLGFEIISNLVKYVEANQGAIFVVTERDGNEFLEMVACYAFDRQKYLDVEIQKGEGLAGQCWVEGEEIYLTDVPDDYVQITSGLGQANPNSIYIVPLKINGEILGVVEMASFSTFPAHKKEFIAKLAESIASTLKGVKINLSTTKLLAESRHMQEELHSQEEEMRQNIEEMKATQEQMANAELEYKNKIVELEAKLKKLNG
jgi:HAMP domain-containing protein